MHLQFHIWAMSEHYALHQAEVRFFLGLDAETPLDTGPACRSGHWPGAARASTLITDARGRARRWRDMPSGITDES